MTPDSPDTFSLNNWRDLIAIVLAFLGLLLLLWRSFSADKQARASQEQVKLTTTQLQTTQQDALDARYQRIADMLGSDTVSTRVGGIYSLKQLMGTHPHQYHVPGMELLCSYVRTPPSDTSLSADVLNEALREDVQAAMNVVGSRDQKSIAIEEKAKFKIHLEGVDLSYIRLQNANLSGARFEGANFYNADLKGVNMSYTIFNDANFSDSSISSDSDLSVSFFQDAKFYRCQLSECKLVDAHLNCAIMTKATFDAVDFSGAKLVNTDLTGCQFRPTQHVKYEQDGTMSELFNYCRITQKQLDEAVAHPNGIPMISEGTLDSQTKKCLVWNVVG